MGCSSCRKRRDKIQISRGKSPAKSALEIRPKSVSSCPMCGSPMRSIHKYDKNLKKVIKKTYCTRSGCQNSKG